jgi:hypothetical protein
MWKAGHQLKKTYTFFKPELADVARSVVSDMVNEMPH